MIIRIARMLVAVVLVLSLIQALPVAAQAQPFCFAEVPDCIEGRFLEYWSQNGALVVFGYPIGPAHIEDVDGKPYLAQAFERNRFELHPEFPAPYDVLLGRLGSDRLAQLGRPWEGLPPATADAPPGDCRAFAETEHRVCNEFLRYWLSHGLRLDDDFYFSTEESLALFGFPISEPGFERDSDGTPYLVQWFERARIELHQEYGPGLMLLGRLGSEIVDQAPGMQPLTPPADLAAVPPATNAVMSPASGPAGLTFLATGVGMPWGDPITVTVTMPDQSLYRSPFSVRAAMDGRSDTVFITTDVQAQRGIWTIRFEALDGLIQGVASFRVW